jgi:hypothetical protein
MIEEWRDVAGYEGRYQVSSLGRVKSLDRVVRTKDGRLFSLRGIVLRDSPGTHGYPMLDLSKNGQRKRIGVHIIVARAFIGPTPPGQEVRHQDGDRLNRRADNLEYGTRSQNQLDRNRHGTDNRGERNGNARVTIAQVKEIRSLCGSIPQHEIARLYGISQQTISGIATRKRWAHA